MLWLLLTNKEISYLFFANDLILFAQANRKNFQSACEVLDIFCETLSKKLTNLNLECTSPLMRLIRLEVSYVMRWASTPLPILGSAWDFL